MNADLFFANFGYLADAPKGVKKLRELILQLAIQGKLVQQDPNDESASKLLERIKAEKVKLLKGKKIKMIEPLPPVSPNEAPYELPKGWEWSRIGEISLEILGGGTPSKQNAEYWDGNIPWASVKDLSKKKFLDNTIDHITEAGLKGSSTNLIPPGRVIVCTRMGLGKVVINRVATSINQDLKALTISDKIDIDYFYNFYLTQNIQGSGMTVSGIRQEALLLIPVPIPPLPEQKRIVTKVDQLMVLCDELETRQQKKKQKLVNLNNAALDRLLTARELDDLPNAWNLIRGNFDFLYTVPETITKLRQAILQLAVQGKLVPQDPNDEPAAVLLAKIKAEKERLVKEKKIKEVDPLPPVTADDAPYELPKGWEWTRLVEIGQIIGGGTPSSSNPEFFADKGIPWLTPADLYGIKSKYISRGKRYLTELGLRKSSAQLMPKGTILFSSRAPIGYVAIVQNQVSTNQGFKSCVPFIPEMNEYI